MYQEIGAFASFKISGQSRKFVRLNKIYVYACQISKLYSNMQHDFCQTILANFLKINVNDSSVVNYTS